jgi:hypothetical protein
MKWGLNQNNTLKQYLSRVPEDSELSLEISTSLSRTQWNWSIQDNDEFWHRPRAGINNLGQDESYENQCNRERFRAGTHNCYTPKY